MKGLELAFRLVLNLAFLVGFASCGKNMNVSNSSQRITFTPGPPPVTDGGPGDLDDPDDTQDPDDLEDPEDSTNESSSSSEAPAIPLTIHALANQQWAGYFTLWGSCPTNDAVLLLSFTDTNAGQGYTYVPCIENKWVYNEAYYSAAVADYPEIDWIVAAGELQQGLRLNGSTLSETGPDLRRCHQPYQWSYIRSNLFGSDQCIAMASCQSESSQAVPYVYADTAVDSSLCN